MGMTAFQIIWIVSASVLFVGWLVVSFTPPSERRTVIEWVSATAMYMGLLTFFISIGLKAQDSGNTILLIAMGLLCLMFGGGLVVSLAKVVAAVSGDKKSDSSATH
jgi:hypothetical protein